MEGALIGLLDSILAVMVGDFSALWYRQGKVGGKMAGSEWHMSELIENDCQI